MFLISYISFLLKNIRFFGENINNLREEVEEYNVHLESEEREGCRKGGAILGRMG